MTTTQGRQTGNTELAVEDQLWRGLQFPEIFPDEMARQQSNTGDSVHLHDGVWWRRAGPSFCLPAFLYESIDHSRARPSPKHALGGYTHLAAPGSEANGVYPAIVRDNLACYSLRALPHDRRTKIRKALSQLSVRPIENRAELLADGYEVYRSWHQRVRWGNDKEERSRYQSWIASASAQTNRIILGAYASGRLVALMLPWYCGGVISPSYIASHTDWLNLHPNDALYHAFLCLGRQTPGVRMADFGPVSTKPSLDQFKLRFGEIMYLPSYTWINPLIRPLVMRRLRARYPWLRASAGVAELHLYGPHTEER